jgi:hypothetical protein
MSAKGTKEKAKKETKAAGPQGFAEMCNQMMSGGMPDCCGTEMGEMMARMMSAFQPKGAN